MVSEAVKKVIKQGKVRNDCDCVCVFMYKWERKVYCVADMYLTYRVENLIMRVCFNVFIRVQDAKIVDGCFACKSVMSWWHWFSS